MLTRTFASIAVLTLALSGGASLAQDQQNPAPNVEGSGKQNSIFQDQRAPDEARPDIGSQSADQQQAASPSEESSVSSSTTAMTSEQMTQDREFVRQLQTKLKAQGYEVGEVDGVWGPQTQQALTEYQRAQGLEPTGELNEQVATGLEIEPPSPDQTAQQPPLRQKASDPAIGEQVGPKGDQQ